MSLADSWLFFGLKTGQLQGVQACGVQPNSLPFSARLKVSCLSSGSCVFSVEAASWIYLEISHFRSGFSIIETRPQRFSNKPWTSFLPVYIPACGNSSRWGRKNIFFYSVPDWNRERWKIKRDTLLLQLELGKGLVSKSQKKPRMQKIFGRGSDLQEPQAAPQRAHGRMLLRDGVLWGFINTIH